MIEKQDKFDLLFDSVNIDMKNFIYDYDDWTAPDERDAINPAHKYNLPGEYNIKLTVITTDGSKYFLTKKLVLNAAPQKAKIKVSMKNTTVNQEIDFSSEWSQWQIAWYFWVVHMYQITQTKVFLNYTHSLIWPCMQKES